MVMAAALLLLGISDCMSAATLDAQAKRCCTPQNCAPGHEKPECFATSSPSDVAQTVPAAPAFLPLPPVAAMHLSLEAELTGAASYSTGVTSTLHLALLI
jgi:hypothetical protein